MPAGERGRSTQIGNRELTTLNILMAQYRCEDGAGVNGLVDMDLDCVEAVALATHFLPQTMPCLPASKPKSHYEYLITDRARRQL